MTEIEQTRQENARLAAIVDRLPKTEDGVPMYPGMRAWDCPELSGTPLQHMIYEVSQAGATYLAGATRMTPPRWWSTSEAAAKEPTVLTETTGDNFKSKRNVTQEGVDRVEAAKKRLRDINTINAACLKILTAVKDKGYGVGVNTRFVIVAPLALQSRLKRATGLLNAGISGSLGGLNYTVDVVYTLMLAVSQASYYVCLPGIKSISGRRMDLTVFDQFDPKSYSDIAVGWARLGAAIGDTEQISRCATA